MLFLEYIKKKKEGAETFQDIINGIKLSDKKVQEAWVKMTSPVIENISYDDILKDIKQKEEKYRDKQ